MKAWSFVVGSWNYLLPVCGLCFHFEFQQKRWKNNGSLLLECVADFLTSRSFISSVGLGLTFLAGGHARLLCACAYLFIPQRKVPRLKVLIKEYSADTSKIAASRTKTRNSCMQFFSLLFIVAADIDAKTAHPYLIHTRMSLTKENEHGKGS